jgi:streptogrisin C
MFMSRRTAIVAALALGVAAAAVPQTMASAAPISLGAQTSLTVAQVKGSVDYLQKQYGISQAEALRRLELQRTAGKLQSALEMRFPDSYAGTWIDQDNGGVLMIASTKPAEVRSAIDGLPDAAHMKVVATEHSAHDLQAAADRIAERAKLKPGFAPFVDSESNKVVVTGNVASGVAAAGGEKTIAGDKPVVETQPTPGMTLLACTIQNCTPPMRGGLKLYIFPSLANKDWVDWCTNGFNVHGSNGWQYTVTAGHCLEPVNYNYTDNNGQWVGYYNSATFAGGGGSYPADGAITPYIVTGGTNYAVYWVGAAPRNTVWDTNISSLFHITGWYTYAQIRTGWVACSTGATSLNTRCGTVTGKDNGIVTNICAKPGDSGSPLFSEVDSTAYGVLHSGTTSSWNGTCYTETHFAPLSAIFTAATNKSGINFAVNTTP